MSSRRSGTTVAKKEEVKTSSTVRRNSFAGPDKPAKPEDQKKTPKSYAQLQLHDPTTHPATHWTSPSNMHGFEYRVGGIDSLIASVSKISISKEDDKTIDAAAPRIVSNTTVEVVKTEKKSNTTSSTKTTTATTTTTTTLPKTLDEDDDELSTKSPIVEDVTASYVSSMKEILSSFDKTLQLDEPAEKKTILSRPKEPVVVKKEKDTALPLPRFLITGSASDDVSRAPMPKRRTIPIMKKEASDSVKSPSSVTPAVGEKESEKDDKTVRCAPSPVRTQEPLPKGRGRSKTNPNPFEEGDISRSSKQATQRRRFAQNTSPYGCNPAVNVQTNSYDVTIDDILASHHRNSMSQLELYGFPEMTSAGLNLGLDTSLTGNADIYASFSASPTPELIDSNEVEAGLGVYSSPIAPLTPPSTTNIDFSQSALHSPYRSPNVYYATNNMPVTQGWSAQASTIGSPSGSALSVHSATPTGLNADAVMEMKRLILLPLSQDSSLLQFTPLIAAASMRLDEGRISCLRDLEKYLLFRSQEMSPSPQTFVHFCEKFLFRFQNALGSIEAVGGDLARPNDTPYYEGYFMDVLAHQREALLSQMVSVSAAQAPAPAVTILQRPVSTIHGPQMPKPMAPQNGIRKMSTMHRPQSSINEKLQEQLLAALEQRASIHELATLGGLFDIPSRDLPISPVSQHQDLGGSDDGSDDNQARMNPLLHKQRKKSIQKPQGGHVCLHRDEETGAICGKKYNRPCDLKKHGKTHSRPHKCSEPTCLYHEKGFPTEKERDRHETDRHSESPQMWYCEFPPCPYKSKRESNCKQHMEKQHDYVYERSKHNPRNPNGNAVKNQQTGRKNSDTPKSATKPNGPVTSIFDHGISTPPHDVNAFMPTLDETNEMAKIQQMYLLTPSPDTPQTFRSGSVDSTADIQQQGDLSGVYNNNWNQFNTWQQIPTTNGGWMANPGLIVE
ncbi:copper-binding transcription factor, variant 2 [Orbilia oligospora]|nr:copper-binding transcription factor [Orbilia oligospora]KAF3111666.1 copper-binding transcription factor, variant 2 [Orbilia oligospora]